MPEIRVTSVSAGKRIDLFIREKFPDKSRTRIQKLISAGEATLDGRLVTVSEIVREGQVVKIRFPRPVKSNMKPEDIPLTVLHQDDALAVIVKPPGLVVHPSVGHSQGTLAHALLFHLDKLSGVGGIQRPGIVHRLDKDASGLMVVAKTDLAHQALSESFKNRSVKKNYQCLVWGEPTPPTGEINLHIMRDPHDRKKMAARHLNFPQQNVREALTDYRTLETFPAYKRRTIAATALLDVQIHTGRTHQIRVHMAHTGHPIVGDVIYGAHRKYSLKKEDEENLKALREPRLMLHAFRLAFTHPQSGDWLEFESPLPDDFREVLTALRSIVPNVF